MRSHGRISARALYQKAATHCHAVKDYVTRDLFEKLMKDEENHIDFLETQIDLVKKIGVELYSQKQSANSRAGTELSYPSPLPGGGVNPPPGATTLLNTLQLRLVPFVDLVLAFALAKAGLVVDHFADARHHRALDPGSPAHSFERISALPQWK